MSRSLELIFGFEDAAPKDVEELVDENETPQETEEKEQVDGELWEEPQQRQRHKRTKRTSAYVAVFEEIMNEIIDHELELLSDEERRILRAFSQLPYLSKYTLSRLLQRNNGQWHPISSMEKFKKETGEYGLLTSVKDLCTLSVSRLLSSSVKKEPSSPKPPEHEIIDLTMDSEDENDPQPIPAGRSDASSSETSFDSNSWFFCDNESKLELKDALHRLTAPDLHVLAKDFKCTKSGKSNKDDVITALLDHARGQTVISLAQSTPDRKGKAKAKNGSGDDLKQTTLKGFLKPKTQCRNQEEILLKRAVDKLGKCVRINAQFYHLVIRLHIIYYRSTEMPPKPFTPSLLATFKKRFYPQYTYNRSVIWPTRDGLLEYERALQIQQLMSEAEITDLDSDLDSEHKPGKRKWKEKEKVNERDGEAKGGTKAAIRSRVVLEVFEKSQVEELWDACFSAEGTKWHLARRPELERFQSGHILTRLMSKAAAACGPLREYDEELRLLNKLLGQKFWRRGKRAEWYRRRAVVMTKKNDKLVLQQALEGIEEALHDPDTHLVLRPDLFARYKKLEARLKIPERLRSKVEHELRKPLSVRFTGHRVYSTQATQPSKPKVTASGSEDVGGGSSVNAELTSYFTKVPVPVDTEKEEAAKLISEAATRSLPKWAGKSRWRGEGGGDVTVEELALQYYAKRGYSGFHAETRILTTIFSLLFWDVLFSNIPGAFETRFQAGPLDLAEDSFYYARKDAIEQRLKEIQAGHARKVVKRHDTLYRGRNTLCVGVRWDVCPPEDLLEAVECLKTETLITICRLFCEDYAARARGVPDLFVWDYAKRECKFVEVKGPGDRPSETQKLWFDTLLAAGADVEICSVVALTFKSVNSKKREMKGTEKVEQPFEHTECKEEEDEYQPEFDDGDSKERGEHPTPSSSRRLRSATLARDNVEVEKENEYGVLSTPQTRAISVKWHLDVDVNAVLFPIPSPRKKHKTM